MKRFAPAAERNREVIGDVLQGALPERGAVLEIASGTGQHIAYFGRRFPHLRWQPSEMAPAALASILAWCDEAGLDNLLAPSIIDVADPGWSSEPVEFMININMIHIAPWSVCEGLMRGAGRHLVPGGALLVYGPYRVRGRPTAPSNDRFDASLRAQDPAWGLRELEQVEAVAAANGLVLHEVHDMPANNLSVIFRREGQGAASAISGPTDDSGR